MEYSQRYFYLTRNFVPDYSQEFTHIQDDIYKHNRTGDLYRRRLLCDFGWGHEPGYERLPALSFDELISLIEYDPFPGKLPKLRRFLFSKKEYLFYQNLRGAISVIMADHIEAFVEFLAQKCETPYFENPCIRENYKYFYLDKYYDGKVIFPSSPGNYGKSCKQFLQRSETWNKISSMVIQQIYQQERST